jgi:hypothetical protein
LLCEMLDLNTDELLLELLKGVIGKKIKFMIKL